MLADILWEQRKRDPALSIFETQDMDLKRKFSNVFRTGKPIPLKPSFCGANKGMYILDPLGDIYTCWDMVGQVNNRVGKYFPNLVFDSRNLNGWLQRTVATVPGCTNCKYALFCGGGCAARAFRRKGSLKAPHCDGYPALFRRHLSDEYSSYVKTNLSLTESNNQLPEGGDDDA